MSAGQRGSNRSGYGLVVAATSLVAIAGYLGYEWYPRFGLPPVEGASLLVLAAAAGVASFFSPCAFPLLVTVLATDLAGMDRDDGSRSRVSLRNGVALASGAAAFVTLTGFAIAAGAGALFAEVTFTSNAGRLLRGAVALILVFMGCVQLGALPDLFRPVEQLVRPMLATQARQRRERPVIGFALFGFGYLLAGFG